MSKLEVFEINSSNIDCNWYLLIYCCTFSCNIFVNRSLFDFYSVLSQIQQDRKEVFINMDLNQEKQHKNDPAKMDFFGMIQSRKLISWDSPLSIVVVTEGRHKIFVPIFNQQEHPIIIFLISITNPINPKRMKEFLSLIQ